LWILCISSPVFCTEKGQQAVETISARLSARLATLCARKSHPRSQKHAPNVIRRYRGATLIGATNNFMRAFKVFVLLFAVVSLVNQTKLPQPAYGPAGPEAGPDRAQPWLVPSPVQDRPARAMLFRPPGDGPFRLAVIAHASTQNALRRIQMQQPDYHALAAFLVSRGFAVLVPQRLGHGATGGDYLEDQGDCEHADYVRAGRATADQIALALEFLRSQPFIRPGGAVVVGHSAGAWGALALATQDPKVMSTIIAFAPGRGGHANDVAGEVCAPDRLIAAAADFGRRARVPVTWLVAANDSYFPIELSQQLADAFRGGGGKVEFHALAASGREGHWLAESGQGISGVAAELDRALRTANPGRAKEP
jgi:dienelactone hydrolase